MIGNTVRRGVGVVCRNGTPPPPRHELSAVFWTTKDRFEKSAAEAESPRNNPVTTSKYTGTANIFGIIDHFDIITVVALLSHTKRFASIL